MENLRSEKIWDRSPLESLAAGYKKIPLNFKLAMLAAFVFGLAAHMYCYTNMLTGADDSFLFSDARTWADGAAGTRWLLAVYFALIKTIRMPWLLGIMTLLLYGVAAWLVCETLSIKSPAGVMLVSGLMVTSPTMISSNFYLTSAHMYAGALLFACLAAYAYKKWRHGWIAAFVFMLLSEGSYAAYISMTLCLFFLCSLKELLFDQESNDRKNLLRHFGMLILFGGSMVATTIICNLLTAGNTQGRVQDSQTLGLQGYLDNIVTSVKQVLTFFLPGTYNTYFHGERVMYSLFLLCAALSAVLVIWLLVKQRLWKRPLGLFLLVADIVCLPLAMNVIGIVSGWVHTLMTFAFLTPWLFFIMAVELLYRRDDLRRDWEKMLRWGYSLLACAVAALTVLCGIRLANLCYTKAYARYQMTIADTTRLVDRIEAVPGYEKGVTPVVLAGYQTTYFPGQKAYEPAGDVAGIGGDYYWEQAYCAPFAADAYINHLLKSDMNLLNGSDISFMPADVAETLQEQGYTADADSLTAALDELEAFPSQNCWTWYNGVLVVRLFPSPID